MSAARLPMPDPPGTIWTRISTDGCDFNGRRKAFAATWADLTTETPDFDHPLGHLYYRWRIETLDGLVLTTAVADDRSIAVVQYGDNPEAVRIDAYPFNDIDELIAWARECRDHEQGAAA